MEAFPTKFETMYVGEHGAHEFRLLGGQPVVTIAENTWDGFVDTLVRTPFPKDSLVLSPELMTAPYPPEQIEANTSEICRRIIDIQNISALRPDVSILLGTPTFGDFDEPPKNSVVFINNAVRFGAAHKRTVSGQFELGTFGKSQDTEAAMVPGTTSAVLICSDLIPATVGHPDDPDQKVLQIPDTADSLLVSCCWAVPLFDNSIPHTRERYLNPLNQQIGKLFDAYPSLQDIVIADRSTPASGLDEPFTAHFTRAA